MNEDTKWHSLLARSAPTFAGESTPPFGFMTSALARLTTERQVEKQFERISLRALFASLVILAITVGVTIDVQSSGPDLEPGVRSLLQVENIAS